MSGGESSIPPLSRYVRPSYEDERFLESLVDTVEFPKLYKLATDMCLRGKPDIDKIPKYDSEEARVIALFGTVGLRKALEVVDGTAFVEFRNPWTEEELSEDSPQDFPNIEPIARPDYYGHSIDMGILRQVEAFGEKLIDEGFGVLGPDAAVQAENFKNAQTDDEQIRVLMWLDERLYSMAYACRGLNQEDYDETTDTPLYHPARFSPKLIGNYPNHRVAPTCLGVAVAASGFMKKAGADFMHAGVMMSSSEDVILDTLSLIDKIPELCTSIGAELSDYAANLLQNKHRLLWDRFSVNAGTHSAVLVRLKSGRWFQFDSNYLSSTPLPNDIDAETTTADTSTSSFDDVFESAYGRLKKYAEIAPNLEFGIDTGAAQMAGAWRAYVEELTVPERTRERIDALLQSIGDESVFEPIREIIVDEWMLQPNFMESITELFLEGSRNQEDAEPVRPVDEAFYDVVSAFILRGDSLEEWTARCKQDVHYRERVVNDIMCLPAIMGVPLSIIALKRHIHHNLHRYLEVGRPAMSLGFSALNNVALYSGDPLSSHFWLSYWPNRAVVTDKAALADRSRAQELALRANLIEGPTSLNYARNYSIISKFLAQYD